MKKMIQLFALAFVIIFPLNVKALSVDKNSLTIEKGSNETINLYAEVNSEITEIQFTMVYTTYDVPAVFNIEAGLTDTNPNGISHKIIFSNPVSGKIKLGSIKVSVVNNPKESTGAINIHSGKALTVNNGTINLNAQTINVKIGQANENNNNNNPVPKDNEETPKNTNLLDRIESEIVNIDVKENIYEYKVDVKEDVKELDLKPIAKEEKYKVEISTQKIEELNDNKITITVADGDNKEEYTVKVNVLKEEETKKEEKEGTTYKYKGKWITLIVILAGALFVGLLLTKKR